MLCSIRPWSVIQARYIWRCTKRRQVATVGRNLNAALRLNYLEDCKFSLKGKMMVDTVGASATTKGGHISDVLLEKDDDGGYASGGWKR